MAWLRAHSRPDPVQSCCPVLLILFTAQRDLLSPAHPGAGQSSQAGGRDPKAWIVREEGTGGWAWAGLCQRWPVSRLDPVLESIWSPHLWPEPLCPPALSTPVLMVALVIPLGSYCDSSAHREAQLWFLLLKGSVCGTVPHSLYGTCPTDDPGKVEGQIPVSRNLAPWWWVMVWVSLGP